MITFSKFQISTIISPHSTTYYSAVCFELLLRGDINDVNSIILPLTSQSMDVGSAIYETSFLSKLVMIMIVSFQHYDLPFQLNLGPKTNSNGS